MEAKKLNLKNFRNYEEQALEFGSGVNILYGDNAQGKTNILEAVYLFSMGKAVRTRKDSELIRHGEDSSIISLEFSDSERVSVGEITLFRDKRKFITVNDVPIKKNSELVGRFRVVYFGPEYLGLVKEGPSVRRKNTDILISQLKPAYFSALSSFKKILDSKNALLKMDNPNMAMLEIINDKFALVSAELVAYRAEFIKELAEIAKGIQGEISFEKEKLETVYRSCIGVVEDESVSQLKEKIEAKLKDSLKREIDIKESTVGPHREDIEYFINGKEAKIFASQGQQKTIVLAQKLAEVELMKRKCGETPILLLDDIMSELDRKRQKFILNHIQNTQLLITCTDIDSFDIVPDAKLFEVVNGVVSVAEN